MFPHVFLWFPHTRSYSLVIWYSLLLKMAIEIVDVPIKNGDFP